MTLTFLIHQVKAFWRSKSLGKSIAMRVVMGLLILYLLVNILVAAFFLDKILVETFPGQDILKMFNSFILYYFFMDLLMRFQLQELPTLKDLEINNMIEVKNLKKIYNGVTVVNIPELVIRKGETIGLVGNNGAGKTTLFRLMLDLIRPDAGEVLSQETNVAETEDWKNYTASYLDEGFLTTIISSHDLNHVTDVCERILLMEKGKIIQDMATNSNTLQELEQYFSVLT